MGRHAGWIAGASALAKKGVLDCKDENNAAPHLIYLPEVKFNENQFLDDVQRTYDRIGRVTLLVAEGIADQIQHHKFVGEKDEFGNAQLSGSGKLGDYLSDIITSNLKIKNNLGKLRVRADTWGYMQRSLSGMPSPTDQAEAFWVGAMAVRYMMAGETDKMVTLIRQPGDEYKCETGLCDLALVAQKTKLVPPEMINAAGNGVTEQFFKYVTPLASVLPTSRSLDFQLMSKKLPEYIRQL